MALRCLGQTCISYPWFLFLILCNHFTGKSCPHYPENKPWIKSLFTNSALAALIQTTIASCPGCCNNVLTSLGFHFASSTIYYALHNSQKELKKKKTLLSGYKSDYTHSTSCFELFTSFSSHVMKPHGLPQSTSPWLPHWLYFLSLFLYPWGFTHVGFLVGDPKFLPCFCLGPLYLFFLSRTLFLRCSRGFFPHYIQGFIFLHSIYHHQALY